jgi:trehalose transport system substrate-binding protein
MSPGAGPRPSTRPPATRLATLAAAVLLAGACQSERDAASPSGPLAGLAVTFSVSLAEEEQRAVRELLRRFERDTGARVSLVSVTAEDLPEKLKVDVRAGRPSMDLFAQDNLLLRVLVDEELVEDLSDVAIPDGVLPAMVPEPLDGRRPFLPFRPNVQVAYVNVARFRQAGVAPPRTVGELRTVARALKRAARGAPKIVLSLAEGAPAAVTVSEWIVAFGGHPLVLNDEGSVKAVEFLQGLWREGLLARESLLAKYDTQVDFLQGETAWLARNWPFTSSVFAEQGILDRFQVYEGWRGPVRAAHVVGGDVLGIPRGVSARQREAAIALARFLVSRDAQQLLVERNAWPSVRDDAYGAVPEPQRETFAAIRAALADGWYRPNVSYWPEVTTAMNDAVRRVLERGEPARPVLDALHAQVAAAAARKGAVYPPRSSP